MKPRLPLGRLALSTAVAAYFLWVAILAPGDRPSLGMAILYWAVIAANLAFV
ncbi:MAG: hypothetical protein GW767_04615, partial [Rhodobacterales bacterium]|nr:hypothetical protein [Rhodobacterales bacterium]